ncbi:HNH endonuclease [Serinicoccus hydrothermalis]|uniref:HNH endonuclease n=1 Tax=Serinicoccus hydrothermalis TaxID=1758689 RepID=UPI0009F613D5|nr:HNH endonuclease signature motif containing protein [Serinicoccus hydrothermalis]
MSRDNSAKWKNLRKDFLNTLEDDRCAGCGEYVDLSLSGMHPQGPTVDHIKSVEFFPELEFEKSNLQLMCRTCNTSKHAGPRSRSKASRKQEPITPFPLPESQVFPGQTKHMLYSHGIYRLNGGMPGFGTNCTVTFDDDGAIVEVIKYEIDEYV